MYKKLKLDLTEAQLNKVIKNKPIKIAAAQIGRGDSFVCLHPANVKIIEKAYKNNKGCVLNMSHHELKRSCEHMSGSGLFSNIWKKLKQVYKFAKDSGALSKLADAAVVPASAYVSPQAALLARAGLKQVTGIGMPKKEKKAKRDLVGSGLYLS